MNERPDTPKPHPPPPLPRASLGYPEEVLRATCRRAVADSWSTFKMKVESSLDDDLRRARLIRDEIGPDRRLLMDANQKWGVDEAIERMRHLAAFDPWWIEEPTGPDDVLGHARIRKAIAPIRVATGVPVCPHAGGVGLCEYVQHLALFDYIAVSALLENRVLEYVDHLHEHFVYPVVVESGRYRVPVEPGYCVAMRDAAIDRYQFPDGAEWDGSQMSHG